MNGFGIFYVPRGWWEGKWTPLLTIGRLKIVRFHDFIPTEVRTEGIFHKPEVNNEHT